MTAPTLTNARQHGATLLRLHLPGTLLLLFTVCHAPWTIAQSKAESAVSPHNVLQGTQANLTINAASAGDLLHVTVGRSIALTSTVALRRIYVANPSVIETFNSGTTEIVLTAKTAGRSGLVVWDKAGGRHLYSVSADLDLAPLRASLLSAWPGGSVHGEASEGQIELTGWVASEADAQAAVKMASFYTKDVVNSLRVEPYHVKQVQLKLRIVEVDRTRLDQFGVNFFTGGRTAAATSTQQYTSSTGVGSNMTLTDPMNIFLYSAKLNLGVTIKDLEQRQILQILAEPTLTAISGTPARFLSGGEFPFPVVQGGVGTAPTITIQFRPYGVKVEFLPTVNPDGSIRLKLSPEVSALDYSNAVTISGYTIPALSTRRAETEVEIQDGQSFIVSGLLDHRTTEILSKVPGIGDVPILGQLFRSKNFNHSVVELVIIATATVVDPLHVSPSSDGLKVSVPNLEADQFDTQSAHKRSSTAAPAVPQSARTSRSEQP